MPKQGLSARIAAVRLMTAVTEDRQTLTEAMPAVLTSLDPQERARAQRLATEALRWAGRSDRLLGPHIRKRPPELVLNALRLAVWEMLGDGAAEHAAVDSAVELVRQVPDTRRMSGMVNGVLRNVLRGELDWASLPVSPMPKWLRKLVVAAYGKDGAASIEAAHSRGAPIDLTPRSGLGASVAEATGGNLLAQGSVRLSGSPQISALAGFSEGQWWVQDAAATLPVRLLSPKAGSRVLDLCAAPGGKTMQLADAGAVVTALDVSADRLKRLRENLARTGLSAEIVTADALEWTTAEPFDAVLLDAPCSATGTIRRHPDLPFARTGEGLDELTDLQRRLFDRAVEFIRPGGDLVYCTCSLLPAEGEDQLAAALARHPDLVVVRPDPTDGIEAGWITDAGALRLRPDFWPDLGGMDGFFIAHLRKTA